MNEEYEQQQFWEEPYMRTVEQHFKDKLQQESEEWDRYINRLLTKSITEQQITNYNLYYEK